jgi:ketosteroid isomerase-like protein
MRKALYALVLLMLYLRAFAQTHHEEDEIRNLRTESNRAIVKGDISAFAASLTNDFVMVRGNGAFSTRETYLADFSNAFKDPHSVRYERTIDSIDLSQAGPLAAEHGHWVGHLPNNQNAYGGTYLAMWRHTETGWKIRSELFILLSCGDPAFCSAYQQQNKSAINKKQP